MSQDDRALGHILATTLVEARPVGIGVDDELGLICVASSGTLNEEGSVPSALSLLDTKTGALVQRFELGRHFQALAVDPSTHHAFVADSGPWGKSGEPEEPGTLYAVDLVTGKTLATAQIGVDPVAMALDTELGALLVTGAADDSVTVLDTASGIVMNRAQVGNNPQTISVASGTGRAFAANYSDDTVSMLDIVESAVLNTAKCGAMPTSVAVDTQAGQVLVANCYDETIHILDVATGDLLGALQTAPRPISVVADSQTGYAFAAHRALTIEGRGLVSTISPAEPRGPEPRRQVLKTTLIGEFPWDLLLDQISGYLFVTNVGSNEVSVIDADPNRAFGEVALTISTNVLPRHLAISQRTGHVFVTCDYHEHLYVPQGSVIMLDTGHL